jgi:hypothetical protein
MCCCCQTSFLALFEAFVQSRACRISSVIGKKYMLSLQSESNILLDVRIDYTNASCTSDKTFTAFHLARVADRVQFRGRSGSPVHQNPRTGMDRWTGLKLEVLRTPRMLILPDTDTRKNNGQLKDI